MAALIRRVGPYDVRLTSNPFHVLLGSIIHQQLSMKAAATIRGRVRRLCPGGRISPTAVMAIAEGSLREAGLSRPKVRYVRALCEHFLDRRLSRARFRRMSDDEVIVAATAVPGVGRWTAEMLLMFCLHRADVWPIDDLGLQRAAQRFTTSRQPLSRERLISLGDRFRPFRTYATWYLWRSLESPVLPGVAP